MDNVEKEIIKKALDAANITKSSIENSGIPGFDGSIKGLSEQLDLVTPIYKAVCDHPYNSSFKEFLKAYIEWLNEMIFDTSIAKKTLIGSNKATDIFIKKMEEIMVDE